MAGRAKAGAVLFVPRDSFTGDYLPASSRQFTQNTRGVANVAEAGDAFGAGLAASE